MVEPNPAHSNDDYRADAVSPEMQELLIEILDELEQRLAGARASKPESVEPFEGRDRIRWHGLEWVPAGTAALETAPSRPRAYALAALALEAARDARPDDATLVGIAVELVDDILGPPA